MKSSITPFQQKCQKIICKFQEKDVGAFKSIDNDTERVKFVHDFIEGVQFSTKDGGKSIELALKLKTEGNAQFSKKHLQDALKTYNSAIIKCPQDSDEAKELLTILISNRSATFFEMKKYEKALKDIDYLMRVNKYPKHLTYKVLLRKAKCLVERENYEEAIETYEETLARLKDANLDDKTFALKSNDVEKQLRECKDVKPQKRGTAVKFSENSQFSGNIKFPAVHFDVMFDEDKIQGRFARATEDINAGTLIVKENAHCAVLAAKHSKTNCQKCLLSTDQPFACENCAHVVFCSLKCLDESKNCYHSIECGIQPEIFNLGASINCSLALRIITQKKLDYFVGKHSMLKEYEKGLKIENKMYTSDDYDTVFFLCRNEGLRKNEQLLHYTCMALFLLKYLKMTNYFGGDSSNDVLTDDEAFIGGLILRHLQILQFNAHEISELRPGDSTENSGYVSEYIGAGLYPTLALFNHSCDPSIVRYNVGSKMVAHAIKPIKAGDIIYENYGPLYTTSDKEKRQNLLEDRYWFECLCKPCVELWPSLDEMNDEALRLPCKNTRCPKVFQLKKDTDNPFLTCNFCNETTSVFPYLKGLMNLEVLVPEAENLFNTKDYDGALEKFLQALNIYYKYTVPPCVDLVNVQQRLRTCLIQKGNKSVELLDSL